MRIRGRLVACNANESSSHKSGGSKPGEVKNGLHGFGEGTAFDYKPNELIGIEGHDGHLIAIDGNFIFKGELLGINHEYF